MEEESSQIADFLSETEIDECCLGPSVWKCPVCCRKLSRKQTLKSHLKSLHSVRAGSAPKQYKLYESSPAAVIPKTTEIRWNLKRKMDEENHFKEAVNILSARKDEAKRLDQHLELESCEFQDSTDQDGGDQAGLSTAHSDGSWNTHVVDHQEEAELECCDHAIPVQEQMVHITFYENEREVSGANLSLVDMECDYESSEIESSIDESEVSGEDESSSEDSSFQSPPLYVFPASDSLQRSSITHKQHMLLICAYAISQKLSGVAFQQFLDVIKLHLPENSICEGNVSNLKEKLANETVTFHDICRVCGSLFRDLDETCRTPGCGATKISDTSDRKRICFATSNSERQIRDILERDGNIEKIKQEIEKRETDADNTHLCDVSSGSMYKELCKPGNFLDSTKESLNITLTWNTDGIPLFKSSSVSLWPVYLAINELPPKERFLKKNLIIWGIWQGDCKPSMNTFLSPFVKDMMALYKTGFSINETVCRAMLLLGSMDLQARAYAMNAMQHNGASSCLYCEQEGKVVKSGKGHCRCFPYTEDVSMRTKDAVEKAASDAVTSSKAVNGFHGKTVLSCLPFFQPHQHIVIDYMHGVLLGINKKLLNLWFDAKYFKEDFFVGNKIEDVDKLLKKIKPPYFINRLPRKLKNNHHRWKAAELRSWFLFYSIPCLQGILPPVYLNHFACLVEGIHLLLMECISEQNLNRARTLLQSFYKNSSELYGESFAGLNVHNLRHYADFVDMWGPLWAWSCFGFESCNGEILQSVHGKGNVCSEIFWSLHAQKQVELGVKDLPRGKIKTYFQKVLLGSKRRLPRTEVAYQCEYHPPLQDTMVEERLLQAMDETEETDASYARVQKIVRHGFVFFSKACTRVRKRNSYTALLEIKTANGASIVLIDYFILNKKTLKVFAVGQTLRLIGPILHHRCSHIQKVEKIQGGVTAVPAHYIKELVLYMTKGNEEFIARFPNFVEMD